jgi:hypothetical protein
VKRRRAKSDTLNGAISSRQKCCVIGIAQYGGKSSFAVSFMKLTAIIQPGSVKKSTSLLMDLKLIYVVERGFKFTNPFFKAWLLTENSRETNRALSGRSRTRPTLPLLSISCSIFCVKPRNSLAQSFRFVLRNKMLPFPDTGSAAPHAAREC